VLDMKVLKDLMKREVLDKFDHQNLNLDTDEFKNLNPTAENIAKIIYQKLRAGIEAEYLLHVTLYKTERNFVEYGEK